MRMLLGQVTSLDGFSATATGYISTGQAVAIAAATFVLAWVGFTIVLRYTRAAKSGR
jgi:putative Mn2+ efflux pump MntP